MRDIDGIDEAFSILTPQWDKIEENFNIENKKLLELLSENHENIGKILKYHLIIENYLNNFLIDWYKFNDIYSLKFSFFQKAQMIPDSKTPATFVKNGIIELNKIRNKYAHTINTPIDSFTVNEINKVLIIARKNITYPNTIKKIEAFIPIACAFLLTTPSDIKNLFEHAFNNVSLNIHISE